MIAILMATYNGEKYIETQLKSILCQTIRDWVLYIRDDGSTDRTLSVISKFIKKDIRIKLVSDTVEHRGADNSFMWLLNKVNADYYMFCDQDDYWLPNKIENTISRMDSIEKERGESTPIIVHSDVNADSTYNGYYTGNGIAELNHKRYILGNLLRHSCEGICSGCVITSCILCIGRQCSTEKEHGERLHTLGTEKFFCEILDFLHLISFDVT